MKKIIFSFFLLQLISSIAQNKSNEQVIDSILKKITTKSTNENIVNSYSKIASEYSSLDTEKGILFAKKALLLSEKINWNEGKSSALISLGENNYSQGKYSEAMKYYESALQFTKNKNKTGTIYREIATVYNSLGNYEKATEFAFKALKISENLRNEPENAKNYNIIGLIYYYTNETKKALFYFNKSLEINTKLNLKQEICKNLQNIGGEYADIYDDKNAILYFNKSLSLAKKNDYKESIAVNSFSLGRLCIENNQLDKGLIYTATAKKYSNEIKNQRLYNSSLIVEAEAYTKKALQASDTKKTFFFEKSENNLLLSIDRAKKTNNLINLSRSYKLISVLYSLKKDYKIAKDFYVLHSDIKDSIYNSKSKETIKNLEDQRTIELKDKKIEINKLQLLNKEKQKYYFITGLILLSVIGSLLFYQSSIRKKVNEKLSFLNNELDESNKAKTRFFSILNHDLRGPVANLVFFLQLQKENPEMLDEESTKRMQDKTISGAENLLNSMEDILQWSKSQMENFKPQPKIVTVNSLFEDIKNHFSGEEKIKITFENYQNIEILTDENYLKTIIRNLTGNAIKALNTIENPIIIWKAYSENNKNYLSISDNGLGSNQENFKALYDENQVVGIKSGLGLHLIRDLAKAINCEIVVDSMIGTGTSFVLKLNS